jgi:hypothetical protein
LVEATVRIALAALALLPGILIACCDGGHLLRDIANTSFNTLVLTPDTILRCFVGFVKNIYSSEQLRYEDIGLIQLC